MNRVGQPLTELAEYILSNIPRHLIRAPLSVLQALFEDVRKTSLAGESLSDSQYSSLSTLFNKKLPEALQFAENKQVTCYTSRNSDIQVYIVTTSISKENPTPYKVFPYHYCACMSFVFDVIGKKNAIFCKHMLATWLANALDKCVQVEVDDDELKRLLRKQC